MPMSEQMKPQLESFMLYGIELPVEFIETTSVKSGVECDVYTFMDDSERDLGIIRIDAGARSPRQRILAGIKTVEGHISGKAKLVVENPDGTIEEYDFPSDDRVQVEVRIGQIMQWCADDETPVICYEVCYPPYSDGRFENLSDLD